VDTTSHTVFSALRDYIRDIWIVDYHSEGRITYKTLLVSESKGGKFVKFSGPMDVYNVSGRLLAKNVKDFKFPSKGVYFVKVGGRVYKVLSR